MLKLPVMLSPAETVENRCQCHKTFILLLSSIFSLVECLRVWQTLYSLYSTGPMYKTFSSFIQYLNDKARKFFNVDPQNFRGLRYKSEKANYHLCQVRIFFSPVCLPSPFDWIRILVLLVRLQVSQI